MQAIERTKFSFK